ncbi:cell surface glycoprotein CD200 receptor 1-like [Dryobates pubescens]|uniref:cell surface glycoprotein CD200 receptor 1-like n=1 Tax=Dryobates pubescens TaxID=118200 RepID=UPI0023B8DC0B|nr:cell surface glycoprotein CD200 receptor 1-like [Dryobates pubescens]
MRRVDSFVVVVVTFLWKKPENYLQAGSNSAHKSESNKVSHIPKVSLLMLMWKQKCSMCCLLAYRSDHNETRKINCSERMTWKYSPDSDPALCIYPVNFGEEGNYTCEIASSSTGNVLSLSLLTVVEPPKLTLTSDKSRVAVCQAVLASAGKPADEISWIPASNYSTEEEVYQPSGTVTRVSSIGWVNRMLPMAFPNITCLAAHPATNQTLSLDLSHKCHCSLIAFHHAFGLLCAALCSCSH